MTLFLFTIIKIYNKLPLQVHLNYGRIHAMQKILYALIISVATTTAFANTNPFFNGYENQVAFNFGYGVNSGFLVSFQKNELIIITGKVMSQHPLKC